MLFIVPSPLRWHFHAGVGEGGEQRVGDALRHLDIPGGDGGRPARVDRAARRDAQVEGAGNAVVGRHVVLEERTQHEDRRGAHHGGRTIHVAAHHGRRAGKVELQDVPDRPDDTATTTSSSVTPSPSRASRAAPLTGPSWAMRARARRSV
jgi:hypothetical protein